MPEPYRQFSQRVIPLPAENVDTDQIVPARYLKVTDKAGLADALFRDWRFEADGSLKEPAFVLDQPEMAGRQDPAGRRQLRLRLVARARAVGARRVGHPGRHHDELRRHLPGQLAQERPAADRRRPGDAPAAVRARGGRPRRRAHRRPRRAGRPPARRRGPAVRRRPVLEADAPRGHRRARLPPRQGRRSPPGRRRIRPASTPGLPPPPTDAEGDGPRGGPAGSRPRGAHPPAGCQCRRDGPPALRRSSRAVACTPGR